VTPAGPSLAYSESSPQQVDDAVRADAELAQAMTAGAASGLPIQLTPLKGTAVLSIAKVGSNIWLSSDSSTGATSYLGRLDSPSSIAWYPLDVNKSGALTIFSIIGDPATAGASQRLLFDWERIPANTTSGQPSEAGLGLADQADPSHPQLLAGQNPGDPLYNPALSTGYANAIVYTADNGRLWGGLGPFGESTGVWNLSYPLREPVDVHTVTATPSTFVPVGLSGSLWFLTGNSSTGATALSHVSGGGVLTSSPTSVNLGSGIVYGSDNAFHVANFFNVYKVSTSGATLLTGAAPEFGIDPYFMASGTCSTWLFSQDGNDLYIVRSRNDGALSWFHTIRRTGITQRYSSSAALDDGDHVYFGLTFGSPTATLLTLQKSRLISASPFSLRLSKGGSSNVSVFESNFAGSFVPAVTHVASGNPQTQPSCPLSVTRLSNASFNIKATGSLGTNCAVTFTDSDGFATAAVTVNPG
jgi:hypothetical protein